MPFIMNRGTVEESLQEVQELLEDDNLSSAIGNLRLVILIEILDAFEKQHINLKWICTIAELFRQARLSHNLLVPVSDCCICQSQVKQNKFKDARTTMLSRNIQR